MNRDLYAQMLGMHQWLSIALDIQEWIVIQSFDQIMAQNMESMYFFFLLCQRLKPTHIMRNDTNLRITVDLDRVQVVRQWRNYDLRITEITTNRINFVVSAMLVPNYMYVIITYMSFLMINGMRDSTNLGRQKGNTNLF